MKSELHCDLDKDGINTEKQTANIKTECKTLIHTNESNVNYKSFES